MAYVDSSRARGVIYEIQFPTRLLTGMRAATSVGHTSRRMWSLWGRNVNHNAEQTTYMDMADVGNYKHAVKVGRTLQRCSGRY